MTNEMTVKQLLLAIAQGYEWGKSARLNADETKIIGCQLGFVAFSIPVTYDAICTVNETFNGTVGEALMSGIAA